MSARGLIYAAFKNARCLRFKIRDNLSSVRSIRTFGVCTVFLRSSPDKCANRVVSDFEFLYDNPYTCAFSERYQDF